MEKLMVGQLAKAAGTTRRTIRFYEEVGLLNPERDANGYRRYTEQHITWLEGIKRLRESGYSVENLSALFRIKRSELSTADKIHCSLELVDKVYQQLLEQRQAIDTTLKRFEVQRQEFLDMLARVEKP